MSRCTSDESIVSKSKKKTKSIPKKKKRKKKKEKKYIYIYIPKMASIETKKEETKLVWITGCTGAGKSFTGDYLAHYCDFVHVDGDEPHHLQDEHNKKLVADLTAAFMLHWFNEEDAPDELWHPYYESVIARVRAAQRKHADVVVTFSSYRRRCRDFVRERLDNVHFVLLDCGKDELVRRAFVRFEKYATVNGKSVEEMFPVHNNGAAFTMDVFRENQLSYLRGLECAQDDEPRTHTIDVSKQGRHVYEQLHAALELDEPSQDIDAEAIAAINYKRFEAHRIRYEE
jgi:gluconate kinase